MAKQTCACKGIRKCAICNPSNETETTNSNELFENKKCFIFCTQCSKCVYNQLNKNMNYISNFLTNNKTNRLLLHDCNNNEQEEYLDITGIYIENEFLTQNEEINLIEQINKNNWIDSQSGRFKQDYGPKVNFKKKKIKLNEFKGLPVYSKFLIDRFKNVKQLESFEPVELCNLKYENNRSACIEAHKDDCWLWGNRLITINLLSNTFLTLTNENLRLNDVCILIPLEQRCLLVLSDEARYDWLHEIKNYHIKSTRIAINIRELSQQFMDTNTEEGKIGNNLKEIAINYQIN